MRISSTVLLLVASSLALVTSAQTTDDGSNNNGRVDNATQEEQSSNLRRQAFVLPDGAELPEDDDDDEDGELRYMIQYKPGRRSDAMSFMKRRSSTTKMLYDFESLDVVVVSTTREDLRALRRDRNIQTVLRDEKRYPQYIESSVKRRKLQADGQNMPYGIEMVNAPEVWPTTTGADVKVCVVDTGIDGNHPDFNQLSGLDGVRGLPWEVDRVGHGTHCSGTIAAADNDFGVVGVAPDAEIYTVRVFGDNGAFTYSSGLMDAALKCEAAGAKIISMSLGGPIPNLAEFLAFRDLYNRGILTVAAAGNSGNFLFSFPASYSGVMSVGALDENANKAPFSQFNFQVDIAAPGVDVLSTFPKENCQICDAIGEFDYGTISGTSMATPHVAGVAALLWSAFPQLEASDISTALEESATDLGSPGRDNQFGHGLVNALAAFEYLNSPDE